MSSQAILTHNRNNKSATIFKENLCSVENQVQNELINPKTVTKNRLGMYFSFHVAFY